MALIDDIEARLRETPRRKIEIPEWGVTLYAKPYTLFDREQVNLAGGTTSEEGFAVLLTRKLETEDGTPAFSRVEAKRLKRATEALVGDRVVGEIIATSPATVADAEKNSERTAS